MLLTVPKKNLNLGIKKTEPFTVGADAIEKYVWFLSLICYCMRIKAPLIRVYIRAVYRGIQHMLTLLSSARLEFFSEIQITFGQCSSAVRPLPASRL